MTPERSPVAAQAEGVSGSSASFVERPDRLLRILAMLKHLRGEVAQVRLDDGGRAQMRAIHEQALEELREILSDDLRAEIESFRLPFDGAPTGAEIRIAQAQLSGWLEGVFAGLQAALWGREARAAVEHARATSAAPPGRYL